MEAKEIKTEMNETKYYKVHLCYHHEQARNPYQYREFLGITTADRISKILDLYGDLWETIYSGPSATANEAFMNLDEDLSESTILQEWEGFDFDALLEDIETGEKLWYVNQYDKDYKVIGYELEPIEEGS